MQSDEFPSQPPSNSGLAPTFGNEVQVAVGVPELARDEALWAAVQRGTAGQDYKSNLEDLLKSLRPELAEEHLMIGQEGRATFVTMLVPQAGRALFLGDALSGTVSTLAGLGFDVLCCDHNRARLAFARLRDQALAPDQVSHVQVAQGGPFPLQAGAFALVVAELGPRGEAPLWGTNLQTLLPLTHDTFVCVTDNALAYKRALGRRGQFEYSAPWSMLSRSLNPGPGEATRGAFRRRLLLDFAQVESLALYPHRLECSHVVHLDRELPRLTLGPKERRNWIKMLGHRLGVFPWLTPSNAWVARQAMLPEPNRLALILEALRERLGGPEQGIEHLIATRGNVAVVQSLPQVKGLPQAKGQAWTLHIPLCPQKRRLLRRHYQCLQEVRADFPGVPVPEPLFAGELCGLWLTCEARLPGRSAPQLDQGVPAQQRMFAEAAEALGKLVCGPPRTLTHEHLEQLFGERFRRIIRLCGRLDTAEAIQKAWRKAHDRLLGKKYLPVRYHADLRPKHVQVTGSGELLGFMDWGAFEEEFLPYVDLFHLFAHLREGAARLQNQRILDGDLEVWEERILDNYCQTLQLDPEIRAVIEELYPLLLAGMAERNWDFSRPYWVHREFGI